MKAHNRLRISVAKVTAQYLEQLVGVALRQFLATHLPFGGESVQRLIARAPVFLLQRARRQVRLAAATHFFHQLLVHLPCLRHRRQVVGLRCRLRRSARYPVIL
jgi:hypothetical protein